MQELEFKKENLSEVILNLLLQMYGSHQATIEALISSLDITDEKREEISVKINSQVSLKKAQMLEQLYALFGKTPDV